MPTLVLCVDRTAGLDPLQERPVEGEDALRSLVTEVGVADPEDSRVNAYLEALRVARELRADGDEPVVALVASDGEGVAADRDIARQVETLVSTHRPDGAVVVVDSADDEQAVPIIESRVRVDAVDRVIVRQARDIESTYYLLKQFLADEELRSTFLVPLGVAMLALPILLTVTDSIILTAAVVSAVIGVFFLYKGLGIDDVLSGLPGAVRDAFYSGQVSIVTYVVAAGLALVGVFAGAIGLSNAATASPFLQATVFVFEGVPWFAIAALAGSMGRLVDEALASDEVRTSFMNLPFGVVAIGLVVRGFAAFFLENADIVGPFRIPSGAFGAVSFDGFALSTGSRLAAFIVLGVLVSLVGVGFSSYMRGLTAREELARRGE